MRKRFSIFVMTAAITLCIGRAALADSEGDFVPLVSADRLEQELMARGELSSDEDRLVMENDIQGDDENSLRPGHHPHPHPGPVPVPIPIPIPVPVPHQYSCYASDANGVMYQAFGRNPTVAQRRALKKCQKVALGCVARGCQ